MIRPMLVLVALLSTSLTVALLFTSIALAGPTIPTASGPQTAALAAYLENATLSWMQLPDCTTNRPACDAFERAEHETAARVGDRIHLIASNVAATLLKDTEGYIEEPIWDDDGTGARTGLLVMHVAFQETRFRGYVWDGRCNDPAWRTSDEGKQLLKFGTCDGGHAYGPWQVHPERGFYLTWDGTETSPRRGELRVDSTTIRDPNVAMLAALHMMRKSIRETGSLKNYTGEWAGPAPKATLRLEGARAYERKRPFLPLE